jgi:hypothetical protein
VTSYRHGARWETDVCTPFTTIAPSRVDEPSLDDTRNATLPAPCPDGGETSVIQLTLGVASQVHSGGVAIANDPVPPPAATMSVEASVTRHFTGLGFVLTVEVV